MRAHLAAAAIILLANSAWADEDAPTTTVHLEGTTKRVELVRDTEDVVVCSGACRVAIPSGVYRIAGEGIRPSEPFVVNGAVAQYLVDVKRARPAGRAAGVGLLASGAGMFVVGAIFLALATSSPSCNFACIAPSAQVSDALAGVFGGVGLGMIIAGSVLVSQPAPLAPTTVHRIAGVAFGKSF